MNQKDELILGMTSQGQTKLLKLEDVKDGGEWAMQTQAVQQVPPQQSQGTVDCWERFLHLRSIKVLLVENDDSTRHVVTALLRNCNYEVTEAANGIQAWKILEDLTNHIDLVLTEVVMPCISGIALLSKIMSHKTRKNIPVIMMSPHDSMGLVFKCLAKGAVDFLVKPIRKNELKNLWQHVWRRCHSSSGSGSESGTQKSAMSKSSDKSDNNSGSNDGDDDRSTGLNVGAGSDSGSGTQSSWTKQAAEVDSSQAVAPWDQIAECPDSTCAQVIRPHIKASGNKVLSMTAKRECQEADHHDSVARDKELVIRRTGDQHITPEHPIEVQVKLIGRKQKEQSEIDSNTFTKNVDERDLNCNGESPSTKYIVDIASMSDPQTDSREFKAPKGLAKALDVKDRTTQDSKELPVVDLYLKRLREVRDTGKTLQDDCNILRHSELSAFSRYYTTSSTIKVPKENSGSGYPLDYPHQGSNGVCNNNIDTGSTTNRDVATLVVFKDKLEAMSTANGFHLSSACKTLETDIICFPKKALLVNADDKAAIAVLTPQGGYSQMLPMHPLHDPFNHLEKEQQKPTSKHDDLSSNKLDVDVPHCGSSNVLSGLVDGTAGYYRLNRSASGSHHGSNYGSNGQNGRSTAANVGDMNIESANIVAGNSGSGDASGSGSGNNADQNKLAHREAALIKFREKRKERCFQKKVRYQSRKRLAEQRPRVRGQFVRQSEPENSSSAADS